MADTAVPSVVTLILFPQHPNGGPITFDATLREGRAEGRIFATDPEFAAAEAAIGSWVPKWTMSGPVPPTIEVPLERVSELLRRPSSAASLQPSPVAKESRMAHRPVLLVLPIVAVFIAPSSEARAEKLVFRDGKTIEVQQAPCLAGDQVQISIVGLPTPIAYARNFVDEAGTFHANPNVPVARLFAPCTGAGPVGTGISEGPSAATAPAPPPARSSSSQSYSAPSSSSPGRSTYESTSAQCAATTKKGTRCSRRAQPGRAYCYQH